MASTKIDHNEQDSLEKLPETNQDDLVVLKKRKISLDRDIDQARALWRPSGLFDSAYWEKAAEIENFAIQRACTERQISHESFSGKEVDWEATEEAKGILESLNAHKQAERFCSGRAERLQEKNPERTLRASFMRLFTTSRMGININWTGSGERKRSDQIEWRNAMIKAYNAKHSIQTSFGVRLSRDVVVAAHLFGYMHGEATMNAIFGQDSHIFDPRNGLLVSKEFERFFDAGKLAITGLWDQLELEISDNSKLRFKDLHNRPLAFQSEFRPCTRYLYFHYCIQVLRHTWQLSGSGEANNKEVAALALRNESGKFCWATPGPYIPKNMLLALVEELGHNYEDILARASSSTSADDDILLGVAANQIKSRRFRLSDTMFDVPGSSDDNPEDSHADYENDDEFCTPNYY
ncbi:uncharacterized protein N7483_009513 [Penicillium malachiteum]|uniref:uncharacterized protein n=1 Tax=Penicillium malachiteum TaxID=1324776 RepID=UPI0025476D63|nr:uncharacterized protein N7483_009513 [Penicillium malachiteum]KAJ5721579.1 hypothetical protein N7483_009513 [Penicillium malachiteum]